MQHSDPLQPAFVLHYRPYRETSLLLELLTLTHGHVTAVARGVRRPKSALKGILQPFSPLQVGWSGRHELKTLRQAEQSAPPYRLLGKTVWCGLYINELLTRLLRRHDSSHPIFTLYQTTLERLSLSQSNHSSSILLRHFENQLLQKLGYGLPVEYDAETGNRIESNQCYLFQPELGFKLIDQHTPPSHPFCFAGKTLLAIRDQHFTDNETLVEVKRLLHLALQPLLGYKPLQTRTFFTTRTPSHN